MRLSEMIYTEEEYKKLEEENKKLKEERDFFKEQAILWRNDYKNEYEKNRKLEEKIRFLEECLDNKEKVNKQLREELGKMVMGNNTVEIVLSAGSGLTEQDDLSPFFMK